MKLFSLRNLAMTGAMSVAGFGLMGVGAHAIFTQDTSVTQQVTSGTMDVTLSSSGASGNGTSAITLAPEGPTGSSFTTGDQLVTITNQSSFDVNITGVNVGSTYPSSALAQELYICEVDPFGYVDYNGPLSGASFIPYGPGNPFAPAATENMTVNIYAGDETTACGSLTIGNLAVSGTSTSPSLDNSAQGESIAVTFTTSWSS